LCHGFIYPFLYQLYIEFISEQKANRYAIKNKKMADFCNKCHDKMGFSGDPDIDVLQIFEELEQDHMTSGFICEGCGLSSIAKIGEGLKVVRYGQEELGWQDY
jgi:hypothetical protein